MKLEKEELDFIHKSLDERGEKKKAALYLGVRQSKLSSFISYHNMRMPREKYNLLLEFIKKQNQPC